MQNCRQNAKNAMLLIGAEAQNLHSSLKPLERFLIRTPRNLQAFTLQNKNSKIVIMLYCGYNICKFLKFAVAVAVAIIVALVVTFNLKLIGRL